MARVRALLNSSTVRLRRVSMRVRGYTLFRSVSTPKICRFTSLAFPAVR